MTYTRRYRVTDGTDAMDVAAQMAHRSPQSARVLVAIHRGHTSMDAIIDATGATVGGVDSALRRLLRMGHVVECGVEELWADIEIVNHKVKSTGTGGNG